MVLVFVADGFGHVDEGYVRVLVESGEYGVGEVEPCSGFPATQVVESAELVVFSQMQRHPHCVFNV